MAGRYGGSRTRTHSRKESWVKALRRITGNGVFSTPTLHRLIGNSFGASCFVNRLK